MPKTSAYKKSSAARSSSRAVKAPDKNTLEADEVDVSGQARVQARRGGASGTTNVRGIIMAGMVALGCWGMAFTFAVFYTTDPNHLLFGGMAALMALMWSVSFGIRVRKVLRQK